MLDRLNNSEMEERNRSTGGMVLTESNMEYRIWYNWRTRLSLFITAISCNILIYSKNACNASGIFLQIRCYFMRINIDRICYWASLHSNSKKDLGTSAKIFIKTSWSNLRRVPVLAPRYVLADEVAFNNESRQNPSPGSRIPTNWSTTMEEGRTTNHVSLKNHRYICWWTHQQSEKSSNKARSLPERFYASNKRKKTYESLMKVTSWNDDANFFTWHSLYLTKNGEFFRNITKAFTRRFESLQVIYTSSLSHSPSGPYTVATTHWSRCSKIYWMKHKDALYRFITLFKDFIVPETRAWESSCESPVAPLGCWTNFSRAIAYFEWGKATINTRSWFIWYPWDSELVIE